MLRRAMIRGLALLLIAPQALRRSAAGQSVAAKRGKTRLVTKTFANPQPIAIPSSSTPDGSFFTLPVSGLRNGHIVVVQVTLLGLSHTNPEHVVVYLEAPSERTLYLMFKAGGTTPVSNLTITFDDAAPVVLPDDGPLVSGTYRPAQYEPPAGQNPFPQLSIFEQSNPNGAWELFVGHSATGGEGSIAGGWSLAITANVKTKRKKKR